MAVFHRFPVWAWLGRALAGAVLLTAVAACGGGGEVAGVPGLDLNKPYNNLALSKPAALPLVANGGSTSNGGGSGSSLVMGADFRKDLVAENVFAVNTRARFRPNWSSGTAMAERRISAAFYFVDLSQASEVPSLLLDWSSKPRADELWVGFADFTENRWVWRKLSDVETVSLPSHSRFKRLADGYMACVLMVLGAQESVLDGIGTGAGRGSIGFANEGAPLGVNLEGLTDWNVAGAFTDVFKTSREWIPQLVGSGGPWDTGAAINMDPNGWVTSLGSGAAVITIMMTDQNGNLPTGRYVCLYDGDGFNGSAFVVSGNGSVVPGSHTPGRFEIDVTNTFNSTFLKIEAINPADYIRNIRLIMPGFEQTYATTDVFHPTFLDSLSSFKVLRFMDWGKTNNSPMASWADRPGPNYCRNTTSRGTSLETMIALCNKARKDMWYCIPHKADDDFVTRAAELIRDSLDPDLRLFLEYSNEVWNWQFAQATYSHDQGLLLWPGDQNAWRHWYGFRTAQVMDLASAAFVDQLPGRLVRIIATQSNGPGGGLQSVDQEIDGPNDLAWMHVDLWAVAPYLGNTLGLAANEASTQAMSVSEVLDFLEADSATKHGPGGVSSINQANAAARGLTLITYEGGQHLVGIGSVVHNQVITDLFIAANRHPRMRQIYFDDMTRWTAVGGGIYMAFTHTYEPGKFGSWGLLESSSQNRNTAYKWLGLHDWLTIVTSQ